MPQTDGSSGGEVKIVCLFIFINDLSSGGKSDKNKTNAEAKMLLYVPTFWAMFGVSDF